MASYSIYFDETGDFQGIGNNAFYAICGFVWEGTADSIKENLKKFCNDLADWLKTNGKDSSKPFPACLHTTDNNALKTLLSDHTPETDILHSRLRDLPLSITGIYTFKDEVNQADFTLDAVYRKMIHLLIRRITEQIRQKDSEADITFHIPTRDTFFDFDEERKRQQYQRSDIVVARRNDKVGNVNLSVSLNTPEAYFDIGRELNVHCSVRVIDYSNPDPDKSDSDFHLFKNKESTIWGYYAADIINYWTRTFASNANKKNDSIQTDMAALQDVFLILPFSESIETAQYAIKHIQDNPCGYLEALLNLQTVPNPTPRTEYAIQILENSNPFSDPTMIRNAGNQIDRQFIHESKYSKAKKLLELLKEFSERTEAKGSYEYCDIISKLMTCYHHEGGNDKAQDLFNMVKNSLGNNRIRMMDICNKYQEFYVNTLAFEMGIRFVKGVLDFCKPVTSPINIGGVSLSGDNVPNDVKAVQARTISSLGSFHAYLGHEEKAESCFREAIKTFESIGQTGNAQITRCHLIQLLLDTQDIKSETLLDTLNKYFSPNEKTIPDPMSPATWDKWLADGFTQCTDNGIFNSYDGSFFYWIWLKAIIRIPTEVLRDNTGYRRIMSMYPQAWEIMKLQDHPIEMIRKYHAILSLRLGDQRSAKKDLEALDNIIQHFNHYGTIPLLCHVAKYDIKQEQHTISENEINSLESEVAKDIKTLYEQLHQGSDTQMPETLIDRLNQIQKITMRDLKESLFYEFK